MLENLQRTSTPHVGLQPNSQVGAPKDSLCCLFHIDKLIQYYIFYVEPKIGDTLSSQVHHVAFLHLLPKTIFSMTCSC